jgi:hypothetical protein
MSRAGRNNNSNPYSGSAKVKILQGRLRVSMKFDTKRFQNLIGLYSILLKRDLKEVIREQGNLFCKDMIRFSPPFSGIGPQASPDGYGFDGKAKKQGMNAVDRDVRKIFAPIAQAKAGQVARYGNLAIFQSWIREKLKLPLPRYPKAVFNKHAKAGWFNQTDFENFRKSQKKSVEKARFVLGTSEGTIKSIHEKIRGKPRYRVTKGKIDGIYFVDDFKVVERYIKRVQARVGKLKSGWYWAGVKLGKMRTSFLQTLPIDRMIFVNRLEENNPNIRIGSKEMATVLPQSWSWLKMAKDHRDFAIRNRVSHLIASNSNKKNLTAVIAHMRTNPYKQLTNK